MDAVLRMLADKDDEQIDPLAKDRKVHELSYDYEIASTVSRSIKAMEAEEAVQKVIDQWLLISLIHSSYSYREAHTE